MSTASDNTASSGIVRIERGGTGTPPDNTPQDTGSPSNATVDHPDHLFRITWKRFQDRIITFQSAELVFTGWKAAADYADRHYGPNLHSIELLTVI